MLNHGTNSDSVKKSSTFMETLQNKLKDINNFSNWSAKDQMVAVTAVGVIFGTLLPFVLVALPVAATGAAVALTLFFAVKAVEYAFKGLKWSAEKTWEGAKHVGGKIRDGAVYVKDKVEEAVSSAKQAVREGTSSKLEAMGNNIRNLGKSMSNFDRIPYSIEPYVQTVVLKTEEKTKNFNSVKEMFIKEVFGDKAVNSSALTKEIFSELKGKILEKAYSVDGQQSFKKDQLIDQLGQQADFVSKLNAKKLQKLLTQDDNNLYEIFSEYHSEIKEIIGEHKTYNLSRSSSTSFDGNTYQSFSNEGFDNVSTDSAMPPATVDPTRFRRNSSSGSYDGPPVLKEVVPPVTPKGQYASLENEWSDFVKGWTEKHKLSDSPKTTDSGFSSPNSSGPSTPERQSPPVNKRPYLSPDDLNKSRLNKTGKMDELVPSTKVDVDADVQYQTVPKSMA